MHAFSLALLLVIYLEGSLINLMRAWNSQGLIEPTALLLQRMQ